MKHQMIIRNQTLTTLFLARYPTHASCNIVYSVTLHSEKATEIPLESYLKTIMLKLAWRNPAQESICFYRLIHDCS